MIKEVQNQLEAMFPSARGLRDWEPWLAQNVPAAYRILEYESPAKGYPDLLDLGFKCDSNSIQTDDGTFTRSFLYTGRDRSNDPLTERARFNKLLNDILNGFEEPWALYVTLDRYPASAVALADSPDVATWLVAEERRLEYEQFPYYNSDVYISLCYTTPKKKSKRGLGGGFVDPAKYATELEKSRALFNERCKTFLDAWGFHFTTAPIGTRSVVYDGSPIIVDDQLSLFQRIATGKRHLLRAIPNFVSVGDYIANEAVIHRDEVVRIGSVLMRPITAIDFAPGSTPDILDAIDQFDGELIASWRYIPFSRTKARKEIKTVRGGASQRKQGAKKMILPTTPDSMINYDAVDMMDDAEEANRKNSRQEMRFGSFTLTINPLVSMVAGESEDQARERLVPLATKILGMLHARGIGTTDELGNETEAIRGMIPTRNMDNVVKPTVGSRSVVDFLPTTFMWRGHAKYDDRDEFHAGCPALLRLPTNGRSPFDFIHSLPQRGGNVFLLGDPRTGKSSFAALMANQYRRLASKQPNGNAVVIIDKGYSHKTQCKAVGGDYRELSPITERGFALFPDIESKTGYNRALSVLLLMLQEGGIDPNIHKADVVLALDAFKSIPAEARTLSAFTTGIHITDAIKTALHFYTREGSGGSLFEATEPFSLGSGFTVFEVAPIDSNKPLKKVALFALMTAIDALIDGTMPVMVLGEELWTFAGDPLTDGWFITMLKDKPKLGLSAILITHNIADLALSRNPQAYIDACGTKILFPSDSLKTQANIIALRDLGLTESQLSAHADRSGQNVALFIQDNHIRVASVAMGDVTRAIVAITNVRERQAAEYLMDHLGHEPMDWLPEWILQMVGPERGEGWRRHAYFYPPKPPVLGTVAPHHQQLHPDDPLVNEVGYAS